MRLRRWPALILALVGSLGVVSAGGVDALDHLPPELAWDGESRKLALAADHAWATPSEQSGLTRTPRYEETFAWLGRLVQAAPELEMLSIGRSAEGREIPMVIAALEGPRTPAGLRASGKPLVLVQAGIHSGEIDGKDAGLMLLRDMTVLGTKKELLKRVNLLFIPILSVDGHERFSDTNRINQRGPVEMGWRTNARNLNLNRDYMKLETEEVQALVQVLNDWTPDLYVDLHVTDGLDYQYDVTWGATPDYGWSTNSSRWIDEVLAPRVDGRLAEMGHIPGRFVFPSNGRDVDAGIVVWVGSPRFSNVYGSVRGLPTILVENHSLKPYDQRVLGTYVYLEATLDTIGREGPALREAIAKDRRDRPDPVLLALGFGQGARQEKMAFKGVRAERAQSPVTGDEVVRWTGEKIEQDVALMHQSLAQTVVDRPRAYYIPAGWSHIADKLRLHGIELETLKQPVQIDGEVYRLPQAGLAGGGASFDERAAIYEGRVRVDPGEIIRDAHSLTLPAGSFRARTDQPLGDLLVLLLEPASPDSLFQWGFFLEILTQPEYAEAYIMEPMAREMLRQDPELRREFEKALENDPKLAGDPAERLMWFYRQTPYFDARYRVYPIVRERAEPSAGLADQSP